ncbi:MAG: hypothetical protein DRP97_00060 [Candidatus Latescibacterota bacterium]|nr:MAG: hypothetical protein DRP97_00060 [Candidatus Latescibacterota bacterium]
MLRMELTDIGVEGIPPGGASWIVRKASSPHGAFIFLDRFSRVCYIWTLITIVFDTRGTLRRRIAAL